jgi:hypothetical protein
MLSRLLVIFYIVILSSSSYAFKKAPKPEPQEIHGMDITYIVPSDIIKPKGSINGVRFASYNRGTDTRTERLGYQYTSDQILLERRTDNGMAGSGVIYNIALNITPKGNNTIITLHPKTLETYQEGLILPFPVPEFDLGFYLHDVAISYQFEIDSNYPPESVKANFDRLLGRKHNGIYRLEKEEDAFEISLKVYPYRQNQSKITIDTEIYNKNKNMLVVDFTEKINGLKRQLQNIANS